MPRFMDVHEGFKGVTHDKLLEAHKRDLELQGKDVKFLQAWADPKSGKVFCLSEGPDRETVLGVHERAGHPTREIYELSVEV